MWVMKGVNGLLVAADVTGVGHYTNYPSNKQTVALQFPFIDGKVPDHTVLHRGACKANSQLKLADKNMGAMRSGPKRQHLDGGL
jgi:hypothetical protein